MTKREMLRFQRDSRRAKFLLSRIRQELRRLQKSSKREVDYAE